MNANPRDVKLEEFKDLKSNYEKIRFLLNFAVLAPSTHNSQPWKFKIKKESCEIYYEKSLNIPCADPENRDLFISIGCAIENLILASKYYDVFNFIEYKLARNLVAEIHFYNLNGNSTWDKSLLSTIQTLLRRINARGIFKPNPVPESLQQKILSKLADYEQETINIILTSNKKIISELAHLTEKGIKLAYKNPEFRREMSEWFRNSLTRKKDGLPGYALKMPMPISFFFSTLVKYIDIGSKLAELNSRSIGSAPLVCVISADQTQKELIWLKVGRVAERLMLEFNNSGFNTSIFVASIEIGDLYKKVQDLFSTSKRPQFIFVIGKIDSLHKPTPRHSIDDKIIT